MNTTISSLTVGIPVPDLPLAVAWYRRLLGPAEEIEPVPGVCLVLPGVWLQLFEHGKSPPNPSIVRFETEDLQARREQALGLGVTVGEIESVPGAVRYFDFGDPFGNPLSFYELLEG